MKLLKYFLVLAVLTTFSSCKKYLNVSDELAGGLTNIDQVFDNPDLARRWYANVMSGVPDYSTIIRLDDPVSADPTGQHLPGTGQGDPGVRHKC